MMVLDVIFDNIILPLKATFTVNVTTKDKKNIDEK